SDVRRTSSPPGPRPWDERDTSRTWRPPARGLERNDARVTRCAVGDAMLPAGPKRATAGSAQRDSLRSHGLGIVGLHGWRRRLLRRLEGRGPGHVEHALARLE